MWCKGCQQEKPLEQFRKNPRVTGNGGYERKCKECDTRRRIALRHKRRAEKAAADEAAAAFPPELAAAIRTHLHHATCQHCRKPHPWTALRPCFASALQAGEYQPPVWSGQTPATLAVLWRRLTIVCGDCLAAVLAPAPWLPAAGQADEPLPDAAIERDQAARRLAQLDRQPARDTLPGERRHVSLA